jgi:MFS transporter, SP family, general alpha glucoside:H+ symporter
MVSQENPKEGGKEPVPIAEQIEGQEAVLAQVADNEEHAEHAMGIWASFRQYPWASAWCIYAAWCVVLLSFDGQAAAAIVGIPQFRKDFGYAFNDDYVLPAHWQSIFNAAPVAS